MFRGGYGAAQIGREVPGPDTGNTATAQGVPTGRAEQTKGSPGTERRKHRDGTGRAVGSGRTDGRRTGDRTQGTSGTAHGRKGEEEEGITEPIAVRAVVKQIVQWH